MMGSVDETGQLLRTARTRAGWSQTELARASGVPQPVISAYESGAREPSARALRRLARSMGLDLVLVAAPRTSPPDPTAAARQLEDVLSLADAIVLDRKEQPLRYPVLVQLS
ncbi:MAG TPA: helix-turn-helix transcriptional regulator [Acidimicrobiales bacterium]|nr:helix-turn-helix transcriptional regulator [Acidimicrobiales bacterium]